MDNFSENGKTYSKIYFTKKLKKTFIITKIVAHKNIQR